MNPHDLGRTSEAMACDFLRARGWRIIERNYRAGRKEIDIIARAGNVIAFIEVKARAGTDYGHPLYAITWKKRREIEYVARVWLERHARTDCDYRFDAVAIFWSGSTHTIEHVEDAWRVDIR